jgi:hypothetical protein
VRYSHCPVLVVPDSFASSDEPHPTYGDVAEEPSKDEP